MSNMDHSDEFEMKPLTPGLGFHKRQISLKEHIMKTGLAQQNLRKSLPAEPPPELLDPQKSRTSKEIIAELHEALKPVAKKGKTDYKMTEVFPRDIKDVKTPFQSPEISPLENINFQIPDKSLSDMTGTRRGSSDNLINPLTAIPVNFSSIFLDAAFVFALSLLFLVSLIMATGVDLLSVLRSSQNEFATQLSLAVLYLAVFEMYVIVARSFFGSTVGEWTFDLQMGDDEQIARAHYPLLVLWRSLLTLITGIVSLPILSWILRQDLAAKFTGLQLYRKNI